MKLGTLFHVCNKELSLNLLLCPLVNYLIILIQGLMEENIRKCDMNLNNGRAVMKAPL